ncbi:MAG: flagellar hook assembly protein FlgD [Hylemonella sp.]|nr:flagellar hook assembly protein FlgD [Hylemonella sp.]
MITSSINSSSPAPSSGGMLGGADAAALQDRFLTLLVAQVNSQDPLNPMDNAQMTSQMAQINTVSGIQQLNQSIGGLSSQLTAMQVLQGASLVGRPVLTAGNALVADAQSGQGGGAFDLAATADQVRLDIVTSTGQLIESRNLGSLPAGQHAFTWDASTYQGSAPVEFRVSATRADQPLTTTSYSSDRVASVGSANGALAIQLQSGRQVAYTDIAAIQ